MSSGELRDKVAFEMRASVDDGAGNEQSGDWVIQCEVAARVTPRLGGETVMAARLAGRKPVTIKVRVSSSTERITTDWRGRNVRTGEIYNLRSIANLDERRRYLDILADAGVAT